MAWRCACAPELETTAESLTTGRFVRCLCLRLLSYWILAWLFYNWLPVVRIGVAGVMGSWARIEGWPNVGVSVVDRWWLLGTAYSWQVLGWWRLADDVPLDDEDSLHLSCAVQKKVALLPETCHSQRLSKPLS